ncbi:hypothetical protein TBKG_01539 [Mycobacterium tuberculosis '98-R604 INH-RIF-EM']|nr:hypothetical protein TBKG_01539 [Mycobacterium tuberculosis '98-R604 INH-RIF-EM']CCE36441.1 unnamed protein product [Mycobacterium tuberculosis UT205]
MATICGHDQTSGNGRHGDVADVNGLRIHAPGTWPAVRVARCLSQ